MGKADFLKLGDWNAVCYQCGFKAKASELVKNWQGYYVHPRHNEPRQPQDFVRGTADIQKPAWVQPQPKVTYTFNSQYLGMGDGINKDFQLGDGLFPTTVSAVYVDTLPVTFTSTILGLITLTLVPLKGQQVTASGVETL